MRGFSNGASFVGADESAPFDQRIVKGDATDTAILRFQTPFTEANSGIDADSMVASHDKVFEIPVNSKNKWMLNVMRERNGEAIGELLMLIKDVPDVLFPACSTAFNAGGSIVPFDNNVLGRIWSLQSEWSSQGQRVPTLCKKSLDGLKVDLDSTSLNDMEDVRRVEWLDVGWASGDQG